LSKVRQKGPQGQLILSNITQNILNPAQCRAARALLDWSQGDLEAAAQVARKTIADFEGGGRRPYGRTVEALQAALESAGIQFIAENGGGSGVRMREPGSS
jgi:transcriptional regulator with XRE-family HTH domain